MNKLSAVILLILAAVVIVAVYSSERFYKQMYLLGRYNGELENVVPVLSEGWQLCGSTEEGFYSLISSEFPMVTYCNEAGEVISLSYIASFKPPGDTRVIGDNSLNLIFLRYVDDELYVYHKETRIIVTASNDSIINGLLSLNKKSRRKYRCK